MELLRKKNEATHVICPLIDQANRPDYKSTATLAAGDIKVCRHTGAAWNVANIGTLPTEIGSSGVYDFVLTATETNPDDTQYPIIIVCHDAADDEWDDQSFIIWTRDVDMDDLSTLDAAAAADAVLDEPLGDHDTEDTLGNVLNDLTEESDNLYRFTTEALAQAPTGGGVPADIADAVWDEAKAGHTGDLKTIADNVDQSLSTTESNIRGTDTDDLKDISDEIGDLNDPAAADIADAIMLEAVDDHKATVGSLAYYMSILRTMMAAGTKVEEIIENEKYEFYDEDGTKRVTLEKVANAMESTIF